MQYAAFISYSRKDKSRARRLHAALEKAGLRTWMDTNNLQTGDPLTTNIRDAIERASCVVLLLSEYSNSSPWVHREIEFAQSTGKRIFIVAIKKTEPSAKFAEEIRDLVRIDAGARVCQEFRVGAG